MVAAPVGERERMARSAPSVRAAICHGGGFE